MQVVADSADHHLPGIEAHSALHLNTTGAADLLGIASHPRLHGQGGVTGPGGMIFMGHWRTEERHDTVAKNLVHGPLVTMDGIHHGVEGWVQQFTGLFRIEPRDQLC